MSLSQVLRLILITLIIFVQICHSQLNEYEQETNDTISIWRSTSPFIPVQSQSYGTLKIGRIITAEFDFEFGGRSNK